MFARTIPSLRFLAVLAMLLPMATLPAAAQTKAAAAPTAAPAPATASSQNETTAASIVAVVNGDVITRGDVDARRRLFALSTGLPITNDVLDRLTVQVTHQLVDERLRLQESQRRHVVVQDTDIAQAIKDVETRNNLPTGALAKRLSANGVAMTTLIDQFRVQIAWGQVLRQQVAEQGRPSDADIAEQEAQFKAQIGQPEYRVGEIFTPVANPSQDAGARRFIDTVIQQLRAGAPFAVVAAQFSQSQTALQGGDLGWVQANQLDPAVLKVIQTMPVGAISNPIQVAGGYSVVTLHAKREVGHDPATLLSVRQVWLPFTERLDPQNPTAQQIAQLEVAKRIGATVHDCPGMEAANQSAGNVRPSDPGQVRLEAMANPQMRQLLEGLGVGRASAPLPAPDGIAVIMVCSRDEKNLGIPTREEFVERLLNERVELASRQLMRDLERRAVIDQHA
jgi:peptidyl-prolyl cis-trans isomerase SurA